MTFCLQQVSQFQANVQLMQKPGGWFLLTKSVKNTGLKSDILSKDAG